MATPDPVTRDTPILNFPVTASAILQHYPHDCVCCGYAKSKRCSHRSLTSLDRVNHYTNNRKMPTSKRYMPTTLYPNNTSEELKWQKICPVSDINKVYIRYLQKICMPSGKRHAQ